MVIFQLLPTIQNKDSVRKDKTVRRICQGKKTKVGKAVGSRMLPLRSLYLLIEALSL